MLPTLPPRDPPTQSMPVLQVRYRAAPTPASSRSGSHLAGVTVAILGLLFAGLAVAYSVIPAHSLPSVLGGNTRDGTYHTVRAQGSAAVAVVLLLASFVLSKRIRGLRHSSRARGAGCSGGRGALRGTPVRNNEKVKGDWGVLGEKAEYGKRECSVKAMSE